MTRYAKILRYAGALVAVALMSVGSTSCRDEGDELIDPNDTRYYTLTEQFDRVWHGINNSYAWWSIDPTDWDAACKKYRPMIEALDAQDEVATADLREIYEGMCGTLIDHHAGIYVENLKVADKDPDGKGVWVQPGNIEAKSRDYYHEGLDEQELADIFGSTYVDAGRATQTMEFWGVNEYGNTDHFFTALIDGDIVYLRLSGFALTGYLSGGDEESAAEVEALMENYITMATTLEGLKGVIIDVRSNGGGYNYDQNFVTAPLIGEPLLVGYFRSKVGLGRYDLGPWTPYTLHPLPDGHRAAPCPVVVLADINSVSNAEITTIIAKQMPTGMVAGERTFGGTGCLTSDFEMFYNGTFGDNSFYRHFVYTTNYMFKDGKDHIYEGVGTEPDLELLFDADAFASGDDSQLRRLIDHLHGQ